MVLPIAAPGYDKVSGVLVAVASPRRRLDKNYHDFFTQVAGQVAMAIANAQAYEEERKRAEALAEIDRTKTLFFSNVSHEFRTPLTLMLNPLEEMLSRLDGQLPQSEREQLQMVQRNGLRLLKLVNTLLDFSRIEAGRIQAVYQPTNLAAFTAELASVFRSAIEQAGLRLVVDCSPLSEWVYVDRDMWEKIVLNLLSNAFKFTFEGEIAVILRSCDAHIELEVRDTGTGIPSEELPHIFDRFHRVKGARGRSYEGSGIGLSLVQELVQLHGGTIEVRSIVAQGTCFTVSIPTGCAHLPSDRISATRTLTSTAIGATPYVEEAWRWLPEESRRMDEWEGGSVSEQPSTHRLIDPSTFSTPHILLADDNADMRDYLKRLLSQQYDVEVVADGVAALAAIRQQRPDLVLTDVMMPGLDGFGLLQALRADPQTQELPIILLSARAGEEARIEGLAAGADDYLTKPFSTRELLARVEANLKLAQLRREATQREQALRLDSETAKQEAEAAYERINQILGCMTDAFVAFDRQWRYTYANPAALQLLQKSPGELIGKNVWEEVFPSEVGGLAYRELHRALEEQVSVSWEEFGKPVQQWLEVRAYPSPEGIAVYFQDVTDRKQAEAEREQLLAREQAARETAEAANRIKDEFLAVVSHELRSPLNPILGWAKLLRSHQLDEQKTDRALEVIERNAQMQAQLINDLLDVSRILRGKLSLETKPVDLVLTIQAALETVRLAAEAKLIQIHTHFEPDVGQVAGDAGRLQQVVWNLLSNAVKFTAEGGRVDIRLERVDAQVQITIRDTGKGIPADFLPYVFEQFRQESSATTRRFGGLGLGLAIVRYLVELHGGTVQADSPGEGLGAMFTVKLPLMPHHLPTNQDTQPSEPSQNLQDTRILVVDDDDNTREFLAFLLELNGANVVATATAGEAIATLAQFQPEVLLSDIGMPDVDGYMLMRQIRALPAEQGGTIPAIALTAYAGEIDCQQAMSAGFQRHIAKPIEPEVLIQAIAELRESRHDCG